MLSSGGAQALNYKLHEGRLKDLEVFHMEKRNITGICGVHSGTKVTRKRQWVCFVSTNALERERSRELEGACDSQVFP